MKDPGEALRSAYSEDDTNATNGYLDRNLRPSEKRTGEFSFFIRAARESGGPVLELASGAGRMLLVLAKAGVDVHGLEASRSMMRMARRAIAGRPEAERIHLVRGDMFRFTFGRNFRSSLFPTLRFGSTAIWPSRSPAATGAMRRRMKPVNASVKFRYGG